MQICILAASGGNDAKPGANTAAILDVRALRNAESVVNYPAPGCGYYTV